MEEIKDKSKIILNINIAKHNILVQEQHFGTIRGLENALKRLKNELKELNSVDAKDIKVVEAINSLNPINQILENELEVTTKLINQETSKLEKFKAELENLNSKKRKI